MENPRPDKVAVVAEVQQKLDDASAVILTEYRGLNVTSLAELRASLREAGGSYKIYKNSLVKLAATNLDLDIQDHLTGPTALALVGERPDGTPGDAVMVAKALTNFSKAHPELVIKGGLLGEVVLTADDTVALSKVAPREELLARLAGGLAAPMVNFARLLNAVPQNFAYALSALIAEGGAPGAPASEAAPEAEAAPEEAASDEEAAPEPEAAADAAPETEAAADADAGSETADDSSADAEDSSAAPEDAQTENEAEEA